MRPLAGVFTDGSANPNPGPGGWGVVAVRDGEVCALPEAPFHSSLAQLPCTAPLHSSLPQLSVKPSFSVSPL